MLLKSEATPTATRAVTTDTVQPTIKTNSIGARLAVTAALRERNDHFIRQRFGHGDSPGVSASTPTDSHQKQPWPPRSAEDLPVAADCPVSAKLREEATMNNYGNYHAPVEIPNEIQPALLSNADSNAHIAQELARLNNLPHDGFQELSGHRVFYALVTDLNPTLRGIQFRALSFDQTNPDAIFFAAQNIRGRFWLPQRLQDHVRVYKWAQFKALHFALAGIDEGEVVVFQFDGTVPMADVAHYLYFEKDNNVNVTFTSPSKGKWPQPKLSTKRKSTPQPMSTPPVPKSPTPTPAVIQRASPANPKPPNLIRTPQPLPPATSDQLHYYVNSSARNRLGPEIFFDSDGWNRFKSDYDAAARAIFGLDLTDSRAFPGNRMLKTIESTLMMGMDDTQIKEFLRTLYHRNRQPISNIDRLEQTITTWQKQDVFGPPPRNRFTDVLRLKPGPNVWPLKHVNSIPLAQEHLVTASLGFKFLRNSFYNLQALVHRQDGATASVLPLPVLLWLPSPYEMSAQHWSCLQKLAQLMAEVGLWARSPIELFPIQGQARQTSYHDLVKSMTALAAAVQIREKKQLNHGFGDPHTNVTNTQFPLDLAKYDVTYPSIGFPTDIIALMKALIEGTPTSIRIIGNPSPLIINTKSWERYTHSMPRLFDVLGAVRQHLLSQAKVLIHQFDALHPTLINFAKQGTSRIHEPDLDDDVLRLLTRSPYYAIVSALLAEFGLSAQELSNL